MEISNASIAAIHGLVLLANNRNRGSLTVREIAEELGVSAGYLAKVFQRISRTHLAYSRRGPQGGYRLALEPEETSLLDIIEAVDGPIVTGRCELGRGQRCQLYDQCSICRQLDRLKSQTRELYRNFTLDMFQKQYSSK